ncbi:hypothetical protein M752DRAFT_268720 [Aspergillus phoenicis ATCC 13157]|uniref:Uncharacterized protein n=1 Tax=Aspergillus phoenicis ATCC 13157 TaxID=1353007 RepID=A0A370PBW9_ASPPH|nr:hypothetical protein M752DRAFT_268720 [Aspergillus phoenicis ATCC 13157]
MHTLGAHDTNALATQTQLVISCLLFVPRSAANLGVLLLEFAFVVKKRQTFLEKRISSNPHLLKQANAKLNELKAIVYKLTAACRAGRAPISIHILAGTDRFRAKYDNKYTDGDFANLLRHRPDFTEKLAIAVDELLSVINQQQVADQSSDSLM